MLPRGKNEKAEEAEGVTWQTETEVREIRRD
jgi:hypothetical protein